ncbi:GMC family oxidoreductase [Alteriqipengyuania lutimaris]|uniref:GMC family oxidoreductase n=1 Tax=Alteriqipengyuania lutimaris TaxID=1538146 RepID=A0A395LFY0_9SPHN|nr:GMC family oxidoreductase N-terminal domain-containing protein [Alteriqipengyuania lutimaris]MBB3035089.1 choline dehydrogenase [Alteriqipengyuania lutimaris]RDS75708.1 GMC family oxidoreductase [Alteriqipengyuania lutimaris]
MTNQATPTDIADFERRARENQQRLNASLKPSYDFIVCGGGSSGSVVARRLAENADCQVLLIEAGGDDEDESVLDPALWPTNLGSARDWGFQAEPNPHLDGRALSMSMGKGLGGGSSVNVMVWAHGHRSDWDDYAAVSGDPEWGADAVRAIYRRIENWQGAPDPRYRGTDGPVWVQPAADPSPIAGALLDAAQELGIPRFDSPNGRMMEGEGGAAISDMLVRDGRRHSLYRAYLRPFANRSNLTILTNTLVRRILFDGRRASGVEIEREGEIRSIGVGSEVIVSTGAINTPKLLMLSGLGERGELARLGIPLVEHIPGVGQNLQDHVAFCCTWEYRQPLAPRNSGSEAKLYWKSRPELAAPDLLLCQVEFPVPSERTAALGVPEHGWTMFGGLAHPKSRGHVRLASSDLHAPPIVDPNMLSDPADVEAARACVKLCCDLGAATSFAPFVKREAIPGEGNPTDYRFLRDAAVTYWHQSGTARMGRDDLAVVDAALKVRGVEGLRVADASVFPQVPTGNIQAPCAIVGERAAQIICDTYRL